MCKYGFKFSVKMCPNMSGGDLQGWRCYVMTSNYMKMGQGTTHKILWKRDTRQLEHNSGIVYQILSQTAGNKFRGLWFH
jgi:hypothetical protein